MQIENIPEELRQLHQWVVWGVSGAALKCPHNPVNLQKAGAGQSSTWGSFEAAVQQVQAGSAQGIGFEFHDNDIVGIDLDHVVNPETGVIESWAADVVKQLDSYTEYSPSGTGLHIFVYGKLPGNKHKYVVDKPTQQAIEMYENKRYFTVTGSVFHDSGIKERRAEIVALYTSFFERATDKPAASSKQNTAPHLITETDFLHVGLEKDTALKSLWNGERKTNDESANDIALMNKLSYWCNCELGRMIEAFILSPHTQQKDEEHQRKLQRDDYLQRTAEESARKCNRTAAEDNAEFLRQKASRKQDAAALCGAAITLDELKYYPLNDIGTARLFSRVMGDVAVYMPEYKKWRVYDNGVWKNDVGDVLIESRVKAFVGVIQGLIPPEPEQKRECIDDVVEQQMNGIMNDEWAAHRGYYKQYTKRKYRETLIKDARSEMHAFVHEFDRESHLFNLKNGTLNLNTMQLQPHNPADRLSLMADVSFSPTAQCERFARFIEEITEYKTERAQMLQKALGYALKGDANEECYFTAIGEKTRNGKGTLFDTVLQIFGTYGSQIAFDTIARSGAKDGSRATPDVARLIHTRLVLANEPEKGVYLNEALLKQLTGNDDVTARPLYGDTIQFKPAFKLFITANSKPSVSDDSLFASGRVKLLPFTKHFDEESRDTHLKASFREEANKSAILNWLIQGYVKYNYEGLKNTAEMDELTTEYRKENDIVGSFLEEKVVLDTQERLTMTRLTSSYREWCSDNGYKPCARKNFKADLQKRGVRVFPHIGQEVINGTLKYPTMQTF